MTSTRTTNLQYKTPMAIILVLIIVGCSSINAFKIDGIDSTKKTSYIEQVLPMQNILKVAYYVEDTLSLNQQQCVVVNLEQALKDAQLNSTIEDLDQNSIDQMLENFHQNYTLVPKKTGENAGLLSLVV